MDLFVRKHHHTINGTLGCFDRLLFRGCLPIQSGWAMARFLNQRQISFHCLKDFLTDNAGKTHQHAKAIGEAWADPQDCDRKAAKVKPLLQQADLSGYSCRTRESRGLACACTPQFTIPISDRSSYAMSQTSAFGLGRIGQISINVHDMDRAISFYRDKLGMKHLFTVPKMAFFDCGGIRLMLGAPEKPEFDHPSSIIYFKVEQIQEAYASLTSRGVAFEASPHLVAQLPDHDLWMGFFHDSEGNLMNLMCEMPR